MSSLKDTLDPTTGAVTDRTRAEVLRMAQADGTLSLLDRLGVPAELYADAALGNAEAQKRFTAALDAPGAPDVAR